MSEANPIVLHNDICSPGQHSQMAKTSFLIRGAFVFSFKRNLNPQTVIKICRSPSAAMSGSRKQDKERYGMLCSLFSCPWKIMSVY